MKNKSSNKKFSFTTVGELNFINHWLQTHVLSVDDLKFKTNLELILEPVPKYVQYVSCFEFAFSSSKLVKCYASTYLKMQNDGLLSHNFGDNVSTVKRVGIHTDSLFFFYKDGSSTFNIYKQYLTVCGFKGELEVLSFLNKIVEIRWVYRDYLLCPEGYHHFSIQGDKISNCFIENQFANLLKKDEDWLRFLKRIVKHYEIGQVAKRHISYARKVLKKGGEE